MLFAKHELSLRLDDHPVPRPVFLPPCGHVKNIVVRQGNMLAFAGLWDAWKDPANGQRLQSYTIITTEANELMAFVHDRMPAILHPGDFDRWLSRDETHRLPIDLLRPFPADEMEAFEVSKDVGNIRNNSLELLNTNRACLYTLETLVCRKYGGQTVESNFRQAIGH